MYKNLFFDFDGTLFNGYPRMINALIKVFKIKRNLDVSYDELFKECMVSFRTLAKKYEVTDDEWKMYFDLFENDESLPLFEPFPGVKELLEELKKRGINSFIYTNRNEQTYDFLKQYGLYDYFKDFIINANKPESKPLEDMIEKYHLNKKDCLVVGDRKLDIDSACKANVDSFSINDYKAEKDATFQGQTFDDLLKIIDLKRINGVVFDLDGVLISTVELHYNAWKHVSDDECIYFDREINNELRGISRGASLEVILRNSKRQYSIEEKKELSDRKGKYYDIELMSINEKSVPEDTINIIKALKEKGIKIAVGSSSVNATIILKKTGLYDLFDAVYDGTMISKPKPDPEVFVLASDAIGFPSTECLVIEDATAGIDAANRASFISVGISFVTDYNKTNVKINNLMDIIPLIDKINNHNN